MSDHTTLSSGDLLIFEAMAHSKSPEALFELAYAYFWAKGFRSVCYVAPEATLGPYRLVHRGMPERWIERYVTAGLADSDPIPRLAFRHGEPVRISHLIETAQDLNAEEQAFVASFGASGLSDGLVFPTYGPFGRLALFGLANPLSGELFAETNLPLKWAIAQQFHMRISLLEREATVVRLSPRERSVLEWLAKGKSAQDIATILGIATPTVSTHIMRIYRKFNVRDRITCVSKARAWHYI